MTRDRIRVSAVSEPRVEEHDGTVVVVQRFAVSGPGPIRLEAKLSVATTDGREDGAPVEAEVPIVHSWRTPAGERAGDTCTIDAAAEFDLVVRPVTDTVTEIGVRATTATEDVA